MQNLTRLYLGGMAITDDGVRELDGMTQLRELHLPFTKIQGHGFRSLQLKVTTLDLSNTSVTDSGLADIAGLASVVNLSLENTSITDDGVHQLARLTLLRILNAYGTQLTDRSIEDLCKLPLVALNVSGTRMTKRGVVQLWERMANSGRKYRIQAAPGGSLAFQ